MGAPIGAMSSPSAQASPASPRAATVRHLGPYRLVRLLGKGERTMAWQVVDTRDDADVVLLLPRLQPTDAAAFERWHQRVRKASKLDHPQLADVLDAGQHDGWPFVSYELRDDATLTDRLGRQGLPAVEAVGVVCQLLQGLAFLHDAGVVHRDVQPFSVLVGDKGAVRLLGAEVAWEHDPDNGFAVTTSGVDTPALQARRDAAQADVLQAGLILHHALAGSPALDEADTARVAARLPPVGRDIVRLPWSTPRPVPEPLRAIVNRASDRQERQRYRSARTLVHALEGWLQVETAHQGGPLVLLGDRIRIAGLLPASPGGAERAARLALLESQRTSQLAEVAIEDVGLSFELLRVVNLAQQRAGPLAGSGAVLTVRRAIAMLGLDGVRRAALSLRPWPGPLQDAHAQELSRLLERVRRAARVAVRLRPAGYDAEVVYMLAMLQSLGRLVVQYHFADDAQQIRRLMQPAAAQPGAPEEPGMSEQAAAFAVLGVDIESIGVAVLRLWGLDDGVVQMARRLGPTASPRVGDSDIESLRATASCANDAVDSLSGSPGRTLHALQQIVQRYARALGIGLRDLQDALQVSTSTGSLSRLLEESRPSRPTETPADPRVTS